MSLIENDDVVPVVIDTSTGGDYDLMEKVKRLMPKHWFSWLAPYRDAIIGALAETSSDIGYQFIAYARLQTRLASATGVWLDIFSYDFLGRYLYRRGATDAVYRATVQATILQERVTRPGMVNSITKLINVPPQIIEPWNTNDCGGYGIQNCGYGRTGYWGSISLQNQVFIRISRAGLGASGVPIVNGYGGANSGYATPATSPSVLTSSTFGAMQYVGNNIAQIGVTDQVIEQIIGATRPTATIAWIRFGEKPAAQTPQTPSNLFIPPD